MFCTRCGTSMPDGSTVCPNCKTPVEPVDGENETVASRPPKPNNNLVWAAVSTALFCVPFGIVSVVYAAQVDSRYFRGDYAGAEAFAKNSRIWSTLSFVFGGLYYVFLLFSFLFGKRFG